MAQEIERKFLVKGTSYLSMATKTIHIRQGYISRNIDATVRIRITDNEAFVTIKSRNHGASRHEWEYPIPVADAQGMLHECCDGKVLEKTRYIVPFNGFNWEVDIFHGTNEGLAVAEIELPDENTRFSLPTFAGVEVTGDPRYYNSNL